MLFFVMFFKDFLEFELFDGDFLFVVFMGVEKVSFVFLFFKEY